MDNLLDLTSRVEATHFWFRGFRGFVAPAIADIAGATNRRNPRNQKCVASTRLVRSRRLSIDQNSSRKTSIDQRVLFVRLLVLDFFVDAFLTGAFFAGVVFGFARSRFAGGAFFRLPGASKPPP